jgi:uncharacterized membrane protein YeiH
MNGVIALRIHRIRLLALLVLAVVGAMSGGTFFDDDILGP